MKFYKLSIFCLALIWSCSSESPFINDPEDPNGPGSGDFVVETIIPTGDEKYLNTDSDYIFDQSKLHTFELNLPNAALEDIDNDPTAEQYVEASLTFEGETISPVGVRYKGSIGAFVGCVSGPNIFEPSGRKTCTKLSMKIKVNWDGSDQKFYKLRKLQLHSMNNDKSQMRERLGYWMFREMGVPAPRAVHAKLMINGKFAGLFALIEQIDGRFTRYHFDDGEGNLYKEIWPLKMDGTTFSESEYIAALKTNEDENPTVELIKNFGEQIAGVGEVSKRNIIKNSMDLDAIMSYIAVDRTIRHDDGPFHWYCTDGNCENHNFYWYEEPNAEKLHLIPWDLDNAFENIISPTNGVTNIKDDWGEISNNCQPFNSDLFFIQQWSAACDELTAGWVSFEEEYDEKLMDLKSGPLAISQADQKIDEWRQQIEAATIQANQEHEDGISVATWNNAMDQLKSQLSFARVN